MGSTLDFLQNGFLNARIELPDVKLLFRRSTTGNFCNLLKNRDLAFINISKFTRFFWIWFCFQIGTSPAVDSVPAFIDEESNFGICWASWARLSASLQKKTNASGMSQVVCPKRFTILCLVKQSWRCFQQNSYIKIRYNIFIHMHRPLQYMWRKLQETQRALKVPTVQQLLQQTFAEYVKIQTMLSRKAGAFFLKWHIRASATESLADATSSRKFWLQVCC